MKNNPPGQGRAASPCLKAAWEFAFADFWVLMVIDFVGLREA